MQYPIMKHLFCEKYAMDTTSTTNVIYDDVTTRTTIESKLDQYPNEMETTSAALSKQMNIAMSSFISSSTTSADTKHATVDLQQQLLQEQPDPSCIPRSIVRCYNIHSSTQSTQNNNNNNNDDQQQEVLSGTSSLPTTTTVIIPTKITVQLFQERIIVTCCQNKTSGTIGTWLLCQPPNSSTAIGSQFYSVQQLPLSSHQRRRQQQLSQWDVVHLLGSNRDNPLYTVYCQRIAILLWERIQQRQQQQQTTGEAGVEQQHSQNLKHLQPKTILFGLSLWTKTNNNTNTNHHQMNYHEPDVFHTTVDVVVRTIFEVMMNE